MTDDPKKVEVFEDEATALAQEKGSEVEKAGGVPATLPGGLDLQRISELAHLDNDGKATAQGAIIGVTAMGTTKAASKIFNQGEPLGPTAAGIAGALGAIGGGIVSGFLFGRKKKK